LTSLPVAELHTCQENQSCAIESNRLAEVCSGTLHRLMTQQPVSDRYILGLAWAVRSTREGKDINNALIAVDTQDA